MSNTATPDPVTWFEVHSADPDRAKAFYGAVFGWSFDDAMPGYSMIGLGDEAPIGGGIAHSNGDYPNDAVFMVQVPDVAAALAAATEHGGSVVAQQQSTPLGLTFGYAANPDGSVFGVWCPPPSDD
jgi:predicted enzyme related to lactoylglutathione lyase